MLGALRFLGGTVMAGESHHVVGVVVPAYGKMTPGSCGPVKSPRYSRGDFRNPLLSRLQGSSTARPVRADSKNDSSGL